MEGVGGAWDSEGMRAGVRVKCEWDAWARRGEKRCEVARCQGGRWKLQCQFEDLMADEWMPNSEHQAPCRGSGDNYSNSLGVSGPGGRVDGVPSPYSRLLRVQPTATRDEAPGVDWGRRGSKFSLFLGAFGPGGFVVM